LFCYIDLHQVLRLCFGNISPPNTPEAKAGEAQGPITALSQNPNGTLLMAVYSSGRIAVWQIPSSVLSEKSGQDTIKGRQNASDDESDTIESTQRNDNYTNSNLSTRSHARQEIPMAPKKRSSVSFPSSICGRLLCILDDAHGVGHSVSLCCFTTVSSLAACVDTGGSVFQLKFTHGLVGMKGESMCFFSGSRGEICAMEALGLNTLKTDKRFGSKQLDDQLREAKLSILNSSALLALASFTKLIIVQLRPRVQVSYWQVLEGPPAFLPFLNWYWCADSPESAFIAFGRGPAVHILQVSKISRSDNASVNFIPLSDSAFPDSSTSLHANNSKNNENQLKFKLLYSFSFGHNFLNLKWISHNQFIAVDENEQLHLLNNITGEILETTDISNAHLNYNSDLFKYPKISEALAFAGERACMHSITAYGSQLLLLGENGLYLIALRTWNESVIFLLRRKQLQSGLDYMEAALKSIKTVSQFDLSDSSDEIIDRNYSENLLHNQILTILREEVLHALVSEDNEYDNSTCLSSVIESVFRIVCMIKNIDFMWLELYPFVRNFPRLTSALFNALFSVLKSLPPFGQLRTDCSHSQINFKQNFIQLPPDMSKHFIDWCLNQSDILEVNTSDVNPIYSYSSSNKKLMTEICLLRLHPSCLDLNYAVRLCWTNNLLDAYLHLYTDILMDFETPFRDLVHYLLNSLNDESEEYDPNRIEKYGNCLLVLLRSAFAGESFCHQSLPSPLHQDVPLKVFNLVLSESFLNVKCPPVCYRNVKYPVLHLLLHYNAIDFLNLLTLSASDEFFEKGQLGQSRRQRLYYCLILTSLSPSSLPTSRTNSPFDSDQIEELKESNSRLLVSDLCIPCRVFVFIANQFRMVNNKEIEIDYDLIYQLFKLVCDSNEKLPKSLLSEFELSVIELIESGLLKHLEEYSTLCSEKGLYTVCEYIHKKSGNELLVLKYQILLLKRIVLDNINKDSICASIHSDRNAVKLASCIFQCLEHYITRVNKKSLISEEEYEHLKSICFEHAEVLVNWDEERTLRALYSLANVSISEMLDLINSYINETTSNKRTTYLILRAYFKCRKTICDRLQRADSEEVIYSVSDDETTLTSKNWEEFLQNYDTSITELFIHLLVHFGIESPGALLNFLESYNDYGIDQVLKIISVEKYPREVAYLYEKSGDLSKATELYKQIFSETWQKLIKMECEPWKISGDSTFDRSLTSNNSVLQELCDNVQHANQRLLNFCQRRCSQTHDYSEIEALWFSVIDLLMKCEFLKNCPVLNAQLGNIFYNSFSLVMTYIPPVVIVSHILNIDGSEITVNAKINLLVKKFISACQFEVNQMVLNKQLAGRELTFTQFQVFKQHKRGFSNRSLICPICGLDLQINNLTRKDWKAVSMISNDEKAINSRRTVAFHCHHAFHERCLSEFQNKTEVPTSVVHFWSCSVCQPVCYIPVKSNCSHDNVVKSHSDEIQIDNPFMQSSTDNMENLLF
ncbi:Vacuolar protein sorting-associated protein 8 like, partial [Schistosoma japonicum]